MRDAQSFGQQIARGHGVSKILRGRIFETGANTAGVELADGLRLRRVATSGTLTVGDTVDVEIAGCGARILAAGEAAASAGATGSSSGGGSTGAPSPHDLLGAHHTLPTLGANMFLASPSSVAGLPSFRAIVPSDMPGQFAGFANPTAQIGLSAVNGVATTAMRSDAAPAINQGIAPTWTGAHIFSNTVDINALLTVTKTTEQLRLRYDASKYVSFVVSGAGDLTVTPVGTNMILPNTKAISTSAFASGFAGTGFRLDQGVSYASQTTLEVDNVIVRGLMRVYELAINKIRVSRGSLIVSPGGGKVASVSGSGPYTLTFDDDHGVLTNDLLRAQKFTGSGTYQSLLTVTAVPTSKTLTVTLASGSAPAAGYEYAVVGNTSDGTRQGGLFLTADDSGAPFLDIYDGVAAHSDFNTNSKTKARLGKLTGITDPFFGTLAGYGLWSGSAYLSGAYINGSLVIGPGIGFTVAPLLYCAFDTPRQGSVVNTNGHKGQAPTITGGVHGQLGKFGGAVAVGEATTNRIANPSFETNTTGYSSDGTVTATRSTDFALFGQYSLKWVHSSGTANYYYNNAGTLATSTTFTFSCYVRKSDGSAPTGLLVYIDSTLGTLSPTVTDVGGGWYRVYATRTIGGSLGNHIVGLAGLGSGTTWYFDGWQCEARAYTTPYVDGSLGSGYAWTGATHASTSSRTAAVLAYPNLRNINPLKGSVSAWVLMEYYKSGIGAVIWNAGDAAGEFVGQISTGGAVQLYVNGNQITHQTAMSAGWHHIVYTWDIPNNTMRVYLDGVASSSAGTPTTTPPTLHASTIQIGGSSPIGTTYNWNGLIDDFAILDRVLTADEITAIYNSNAPLNVTRSNFELVLTEEGYGKVIANAGGIFGTNVSYKPTFTLVNATIAVNGETLDAGDTMLGDNTSDRANVLFDQSAGQLKFRGGTTTQAYVDTSGSIVAGAGFVAMNASGVFLAGDYQPAYGTVGSLQVRASARLYLGASSTSAPVIYGTTFINNANTDYSGKVTISMPAAGLGGSGYEFVLDGYSGDLLWDGSIGSGVRVPRSSGTALFALDTSGTGSSITLANAATTQPFGNSNNFSGLILITNTSNNSAGLFLAGGGTVTLISESVASTYSAAIGTASRINVYYNSSVLTIQNNAGASRTMSVTGFRIKAGA